MAVIDVKHFQKSFRGKTVHRDISFSVREGECLGLIGGSGVGKSVILRSLIGLEKADGGRIMIEGEDITRFSEKELTPIRVKVAYVFQNGALFDSLTVYENLAFPLKEHTALNDHEIEKRITAQLAEFGLSGNEALYPNQLSGGMQKRVGIARSIIIGPKVILYDEPTAGLDPYNTLKIQEMILRLKEKGVTSILVTHDMPTAFAVCDRFCLIGEGRIRARGTREELESEKEGYLQSFIRGEKGV